MKRVGHLYEKMCDKTQIRVSIRNAMKGKKKRREVKEVEEHFDYYVDQLYDMLINRSYVPTVPKHKTIWDKCGGKERTISIVPFFPDACVHRLAVDVAKDKVFMKHMYTYSCASIPGRGGAHAKKYIERLLRDKKHTKYAIKLDIKKYYPSIRPEIMMNRLAFRIKDEEYLDLVHSIITSDPDETGLAIGFYINQWLANYLLEDIDHAIPNHRKGHTSPRRRTGQQEIEEEKEGNANKRKKHIFYVRNMDDMIIIGSNKRDLERAAKTIKRRLSYLHLELKPNYAVFTVDEVGIDFVGYRFFHGYTLLRRHNSLRLMQRIRKVHKKQENDERVTFTEAAGLLSLIGQLKQVCHHVFNTKYLPMINIDALKEIVRKYVKKKKAGKEVNK